MRRDTNDLDWLVHRATDIIKECQMNSMSWAMLTEAAWDVTWRAAGCATWNWDIAGDAVFNAAVYASRNAGRGTAWSAARIAVWRAIKDVAVITGHNIIELVQSLGIKDKGIGEKCYQIAECKTLLSINKELCLKIMAITKEHGLPKSIQIPREKLAEIQSSPWIQQYVELYEP